MISPEYLDLKDCVVRIEAKVDTMVKSLKSCQERCHIDNPKKGWRRFFRSLSSLVCVIF